jgi:hypothetical protein
MTKRAEGLESVFHPHAFSDPGQRKFLEQRHGHISYSRHAKLVERRDRPNIKTFYYFVRTPCQAKCRETGKNGTKPTLRAWFVDGTTSVGKIRHEALSFRPQPINRSRRRDVERLEISISPREVGRLFGHLDGSEMVALRIPDPNALGTGHI